MKKVLSSVSTNMEKATEYFIEMIEGYLSHSNYSVTGSGVLPDLALTVKCERSEAQFMPTIELEVNEYEKDTYEVIPKLSFPDLDQRSMNYYDDIHYWIDEWSRVGGEISAIVKNISFCPDDYEDFE